VFSPTFTFFFAAAQKPNPQTSVSHPKLYSCVSYKCMNRVKRFSALPHPQRKANQTNHERITKTSPRDRKMELPTQGGRRGIQRLRTIVEARWRRIVSDEKLGGLSLFLLHLSPKYLSNTHDAKIKPKK
jgi:hypothetical protein